MPYHNPTSSLLFQGGTVTSHIRRARTPQESSKPLPRAPESSTIPSPSSGTNPYGTREAISIDHLPVEILAEIFLLCPEGSHRRFQFDRPEEPRQRRAPLLLCQICRHWRKLVLSLPLLWYSLSGTGPFTPHPAFIKLWLARSRGLPLYLCLAPPSMYDDKPRFHAHASKMFDLFSNEMHRWRTISFILDSNLARQFIATVEGSKAQILEELELVFKGLANRETAEVSTLIPSFSNLRKLSWYGNMSATSLRNIPFHQLTHVYLASRNSAQDVVTCLSRCVTAIKIYWDCVKCADPPSLGELPQTTLPHLQSLCLKGTGDLAHILSRFTLPSLEYLSIRTRSWQQDHVVLEDFFDRSSCPLQQFVLQDDNVHQESVIKYLTIPFLEKIPDIRVTLSYSNDILQEMQEVKDAQDTPTFRRLQIGYPEGRWPGSKPAFTWM